MFSILSFIGSNSSQPLLLSWVFCFSFYFYFPINEIIFHPRVYWDASFHDDDYYNIMPNKKQTEYYYILYDYVAVSCLLSPDMWLILYIFVPNETMQVLQIVLYIPFHAKNPEGLVVFEPIFHWFTWILYEGNCVL